MQFLATDVARGASVPDPSWLITRPSGAAFLRKLRAELAKAGTNSCVLLDFAGVQLMDGSFADEVLGSLGLERIKKKSALPRMVLAGLNVASQDNLRYALVTRAKLERAVPNLVYPVLDSASHIALIGAFEASVGETFRLLQRNVTATARDVQEHFGSRQLAINAASTRLKVLYDLGLAVRSDQREAPGGQFTYRLPV